MKQYSYKVIKIDNKIEYQLNEMGKKGWNLIHIISNLFIFQKENEINIKVKGVKKNAGNKSKSN